jgi:hypothetical protein
MTCEWLTKEEAMRAAFDRRWRGLPHSKLPILVTDFDAKHLRVIEVIPGEWDDPRTWIAIDREMTEREFIEINSFIQQLPNGIGAVGSCITKHLDHDVHVRGYVKRPKREGSEVAYDWILSIDIEKIKTRYGAKSSKDIGDYDRFLKDHSKS